MSKTPLELTRSEILAHRRRVGALDQRLPTSRASIEHAALAGLQDSMPRAALLSIHARVEGTEPTTWEDPALIQVWGPRFSAYVIAARDRALFTLGRLPDDAKGRRRAEETAARLHEFLAGRRMRYDDAGDAMGMNPNALRYAAPTGTVLMRWEGARRPVIWSVPPPDMEPTEARHELARRYIHTFGPTTAAAFAEWAGIGTGEGRRAFEALTPELAPAVTPIGEGSVLVSDEASFRAPPSPAAPARLLPSGDPYFLLWGRDRAVLVPDETRRGELWTSRVWPGALLVDGEIMGVWRRANALVEVETWRRPSAVERAAVEAEAASLPLPGLTGPITVRWSD
ncbi:MAG TPA: crosslink repair DNA glycosylase YcaQ family protein [Candidatus Limnocylindrales bacterium]|nr:crosslink repair DNA glycosylase YcaQ family protein [Candidatus Limnocylindrales bacterium]